MFTHERPTPARRRARGLRAGLTATATTLVLAASAAPAAADTPTAWEQPPEVSVLGFLLVLVILPVGLALVIALLSVLPSLAGDKDYEGGGWRGDAEWFGAPTKGVGAADSVTPEQLEASSKGSGAPVPAGELSARQQAEIDRAMRRAETTCRFEFSVFVGHAQGPSRDYARRLHAALTSPARSVLVMVDPAARVLEIVTGAEVRHALDDDAVGLAASGMQSAFAEGDLVGGLTDGIGRLADAASRSRA